MQGPQDATTNDTIMPPELHYVTQVPHALRESHAASQLHMQGLLTALRPWQERVMLSEHMRLTARGGLVGSTQAHFLWDHPFKGCPTLHRVLNWPNCGVHVQMNKLPSRFTTQLEACIIWP